MCLKKADPAAKLVGQHQPWPPSDWITSTNDTIKPMQSGSFTKPPLDAACVDGRLMILTRTKKPADRMSLQCPDSHPCTPDARYFVVRGRLWRLSNPALDPDERERLVHELMAARRAVRTARGDADALRAARARVDAAKRALGERGLPWWTDGAPDYNRRMVIHTPYAEWFALLAQNIEK